MSSQRYKVSHICVCVCVRAGVGGEREAETGIDTGRERQREAALWVNPHGMCETTHPMHIAILLSGGKGSF